MKPPERTPLDAIIRENIALNGPMPVAAYMNLCLNHPKHGYYATRHPIGAPARGGDFVTAPEVSQMFGELIGVWCMAMWQTMGSPERVLLAEMGPGRGTLIADLLRAAKSLPAFANAIEVHMIETSPSLTALQKRVLENYSGSVVWHLSFSDFHTSNQASPALFVANELLDALPFRQFVKTENDWLERCVGLGSGGKLVFTTGTARLDEKDLPADARRQETGTVFEASPAREALVSEVAHRIAEVNGAALFIDYGQAKSDYGDTFQALRGHAFASPLEAPGLADLTSHVDFESLARLGEQTGCDVAMTTQGAFLQSLGLLERAGRLGAGEMPEGQANIRRDVERLAGSDEMGTLFKVMALTSPSLANGNLSGFSTKP